MNLILKIIESILPYGLVKLFLIIKKRNDLYKYRSRGNWKRPNKKNDACLILANGPSASEIQEDIIRVSKTLDIISVNFSANTDLFKTIRPCKHVLLDNDFFDPDSTDPELITLKKNLDSLDWDINLIVLHHHFKFAKENYTGKNVEITTIPPSDGRRYKNRKLRLINNGLLGFGTHNVVVGALYAAVVSGYKKIYIAGLDLNYPVSVSKQCILKLIDAHYYTESDDEETMINPVRAQRSVVSFYEEFYQVHREMERVKDYANANNIEIINLSERSMVDAFPKGKLDGTIYPYKK